MQIQRRPNGDNNKTNVGQPKKLRRIKIEKLNFIYYIYYFLSQINKTML